MGGSDTSELYIVVFTPHEHDVSLAYVLLAVSAEEQITSTCLLNNLQETRLVDWQYVAIPCVDTVLVDVHNHDLDLRALQGNHGHRGATHIAGTDAANLHLTNPLVMQWTGIQGMWVLKWCN
jgi:hypothetical protein